MSFDHLKKINKSEIFIWREMTFVLFLIMREQILKQLIS